jgi:hypothetical protein
MNQKEIRKENPSTYNCVLCCIGEPFPPEVEARFKQKVTLSFTSVIDIQDVSMETFPRDMMNAFIVFCDMLMLSEKRILDINTLDRRRLLAHTALVSSERDPLVLKKLYNQKAREGIVDDDGCLFTTLLTKLLSVPKPTLCFLKGWGIEMAACNWAFNDEKKLMSYVNEIAVKKKPIRMYTAYTPKIMCPLWLTTGLLIRDCL